MEYKLFIVYYNSVACIVASLIPCYTISLFCEHINNLALTLITPLRTDYYDILSHGYP